MDDADIGDVCGSHGNTVTVIAMTTMMVLRLIMKC